MATVRAPERSAAQLATSRVVDAETERVIAGDEPRFPSFSRFIPSDLVTDTMVRESHEDGQAVVVVDEHENVRVLPAP